LLESLNVFELFGAGFAPVTRASQQRVKGCVDRDELSGNNFRSRDKRLQVTPPKNFALCSAATAFGAGRIDILPGQANAASWGLAIDDRAACSPRLSATFPAAA
jgi:hypothetical protein